jgi:predicted nucleic acid-binding Zn ribbon protein
MDIKKPYSKKKICINCEKEYNATSPQSRVCSNECKKAVRKKTYTKSNKKRIEENRITHKNCVNCGEKFELKSNSQRYCSDKCKWDAGVMAQQKQIL